MKTINDKEFISKFWSKHKVVGDCWNWTGNFTRGDYGSIQHKGKMYRAHRLSYLFQYGEFENSLLVCHKCDNPSCINPEHLFLGTHKDNSRDMHAKGRAPKSNPKVSGVNHGHAKLKEQDIYEIRYLGDKGYTKVFIGSIYGIRDSHVCKILKRKIWSHL